MKAAITHGVAFAAGAIVTLVGLAFLAFASPDVPASAHEAPAVVHGSVGVIA